jgi:hypothetical protein
MKFKIFFIIIFAIPSVCLSQISINSNDVMNNGASQSWHFLSSPVADQAISPAFTTEPTASYDFFTWYEPTGAWVNFKNTTVYPTWTDANGSSNFVAGRGYLVEYLGANITKTFAGNLYNGAISYPLTKNGAGTYGSYNLVGNPYPSAIDWKAATGWGRSSLVESGSGFTLYIWNDAVGGYGSFNSAGLSGSGSNGASQYIPAGQGFMVQTTASGELAMNNDVRAHAPQPFLKSTDAVSNILRMKVSGNSNTYTDEIVIEFGHQTASGGAEKMFGFYEAAPRLFTVKTDGNYSIDFRGQPGAVTIPVSFKAGYDGNYTLTANQIESFTSWTVITLEDLQTAKSQNLMQNPDYGFSAKKTDGEARFLLHFGGAFGVDEKENGKFVDIYASGSSVCVSNNSGKPLNGKVFIYNMIGQQLMAQPIGNDPVTIINFNGVTGYYVVKVITTENACSGKVFIH